MKGPGVAPEHRCGYWICTLQVVVCRDVPPPVHPKNEIAHQQVLLRYNSQVHGLVVVGVLLRGGLQKQPENHTAEPKLACI